MSHPNGDMLVYAMFGEPLNMLPPLATDHPSHEVTGLVYNGLIAVDKKLNLKGDLAKRWEVSSDNLKITFHLRNDVLWHDGVPFNAEDVIFTYEFIVNPNTPTAYGDDFKHIKNIYAPDNWTVVVEYNEPYAPALLSWGTSILPKHLLADTPPVRSALQRNPIGTGPFIFAGWEANKSITLHANPAYYKGQPYISTIQFRFFQDQSAGFMELLNGSVDVMPLTPAQYMKQTDTSRFSELYNKYDYPALAYSYIGYNLRSDILGDKRVRKALALATPKEQIIDNVMLGLAQSVESPYLPGTLWYNSKLTKTDYAPEKALKLLNEAGWVKSASGLLEKSGQPLKLTLTTNQNPTRARILEILQQSWSALGIDVSIRVLEWGIFINEYVNKGNFDVIMLGWTMGIDPNQSAIWHSAPCDNSVATLNYICFNNARVDSLLELGLKTFNEKQRKGYYDELQTILADEQPYTFLYAPREVLAVAKRFKGVELSPAGVTYNIDEWYVPKNEQKYR
ncbi:peptide-binding protein [Deferribacterales bacterium]|nr:peptide-binding protein [Deferribacterales bacterium]